MKSTPTRTCIACRGKHPATELVRFGLSPQRHLQIGRGDGRGAWLCPSGSCVARLRKRKGAMGRALSHPGLDASQLVPILREHLDQKILRLLIRCQRSGLIVSGRTALREWDNGSRMAIARVLSQGATPTRLRRIPADLVTYAGTAHALGHALNMGARSQLVLLRGGPSEALLRELRHRQGLG